MRIKPKLWHPWPKPEPPHSSVLRSEKGYLKEYLLFRLLVIVAWLSCGYCWLYQKTNKLGLGDSSCSFKVSRRRNSNVTRFDDNWAKPCTAITIPRTVTGWNLKWDLNNFSLTLRKVFLLFCQPSWTHTHTVNITPSSSSHTVVICPLLTSLVTTPRTPSHAALGSHCVFITIKESPACLAIRPHYSALRFLTLVTLWSVIWPALMQDFLAGVSPQVCWEVGRQTHIDCIRVDVHAS